MSELVGKSISELRKLLLSKQVSSLEILRAHQEQIKEHESNIHAFLCCTDDLALKQAKAIDEKIARGEELPVLAGIPVAIKDNMCIPGYPTTCGSKILAGFQPPYQCTAVCRLFDAGAVCVGKTNMDEFAMGSSTENSAFKRTINPWDAKHVPGGSSGGSATAVASGFAVVALGSDTGGSVRLPAAFCGVVGMKPTYGMVSRFGLIAYASSLDQIGPFARSVEDTAIVLSVIAGHDKKDSTSLSHIGSDAGADAGARVDRFDFAAQLKGKNGQDLVKGLKIGIIKELIGDGIEGDTVAAVTGGAQIFEKLGARVEEISIPTAKHALPVYYLIATAEASANLARYDGVRYGYRSEDCDDLASMYMSTRQQGFGSEVKRRIMLGTYALSTGYYDAYYKKAQQVRRLLKEEFDRVFAQYDLVICPTSPSVAFEFDEKTDDPLTMYLTDIATIPANLAGLPGISIPAGFGNKNLPIGMQILGKPLSDLQVLQAAYAFEQATQFHVKMSPVMSAAR